MSELRINKDNVSHIRLFDERRGVREGYWSNEFYKLLPYKKKSYWFISEKYPEAFYKNGVYSLDNNFGLGGGYDYYTKEEVLKLNDVFVKGVELYTKPAVKIYSGEYLIDKMYFDSFEEARAFCDDKFSNVNVIVS